MLQESAAHGQLVAIIGSGVSMGLTGGKVPNLSWKGLIKDGFQHGVKKGVITNAQMQNWKTQLNSSDLDDLLGAAEFMGRKLGAPSGDLYARWLKEVFKSAEPTNRHLESAIRSLHSAKIPLCTLNYDQLLERVTELPAISMTDHNKVVGWFSRNTPGILHLHGSWDAPASCILGIRDYETTLGNDVRDLIQRNLASFSRLLFVGCGDTFTDPNFTALIKWLRTKMGSAIPQHFALVTDNELSSRHGDPTWRGFVDPLSYGSDHSHLAAFLLKHFSRPSTTSTVKKTSTSRTLKKTSRDAALLEAYRSFILTDCGQMTIEGVQADMETSQRKFTLERLFVPLELTECPPDISAADPEREQKLIEWHKKNAEPQAFGSVFLKHDKLALLALPGGGKTLLLKRVAVAYADAKRRSASDDQLPDLELTPVMIRCREWSDHIHQPIETLLKNLPDITGQTSLTGLRDALIPLFKAGRALLLVDGLDEIHNDAHRTIFAEHLEKFLEQYKKTRLIVTSREAGFDLVAPCLTRFCTRWRVAPLASPAIRSLCGHWHRLMLDETPTFQAEADKIADQILGNNAVLRLAENPLLLTMLLVVKHGAGRLPPDRVTLYSRATEVLLNTWNIKGHEPLNPKEAVPQLAYVAFSLMKAGKQSATESELLTILEEARASAPQIRRYATDSPHAFLKRVELRSSLLLNAGYQVDGQRTVPIYQFRHLTFQEYLAAVAAVEGHYRTYKKTDSVLTPLQTHLIAEEWKEVIPMAAVLARKQAEPLIAALVSEAKDLQLTAQITGDSKESRYTSAEISPAIERLTQSLTEAAEATSETLTAALEAIAFFAAEIDWQHDWRGLSTGPYGDELRHQMWVAFNVAIGRRSTRLGHTCRRLAGYRRSVPYWNSDVGQTQIQQELKSKNTESIALGLFTYLDIFFDRGATGNVDAYCSTMSAVERLIFHKDSVISILAAWAWAIAIDRKLKKWPLLSKTRDRLVTLWLSVNDEKMAVRAAIALSVPADRYTSTWKPRLTSAQVKRIYELDAITGIDSVFHHVACIVVAFYARNIWSEDELLCRYRRLTEVKSSYLREQTQKVLKLINSRRSARNNGDDITDGRCANIEKIK